MNLSVLITTMNRTADLAECVQSLRLQTETPLEVIVVDNGPTAETGSLVSDYSAHLPMKYLVERRRGISFARNLALASATGDIVAFADDDCVLDPNWAAEALSSFSSRPEVDVVVGRSLNHFPSNVAAQASYFFYRKWFDTAVNNFDTKNIAFKRSIVVENDLVFESHLYYGEDISFGQRLLNLGKVFAFNEKMLASHKEPRSLSHYHRSRFQRGKMVYFLQKIKKSDIEFAVQDTRAYRKRKRRLLRDLARELSPMDRPGFLLCIGSGYIAQKIGYYTEAASYAVKR